MTRVPVHPELLRWARQRAGRSVDDLVQHFPQLPAWERGDKQPTFKQLEAFAKATHAPFGFLFLAEPPEERLPIPDFRTVAHGTVRPSPDLLDTIYGMQRRQDWLRRLRRPLLLRRLPQQREPLRQQLRFNLWPQPN